MSQSQPLPRVFPADQIGNTLAVDGGVWGNSPTTIAQAERPSMIWRSKSERVEMLTSGRPFPPSKDSLSWSMGKSLEPLSSRWVAGFQRS